MHASVVRPSDEPWRASPMPGVERCMLDRVGDEIARATSIVRYAPGSSFSAHRHDGGEEIFVLDGVFSDDSGDFGPGTYLRNPIGTAHAPSSAPGCEIFVKLHQFARNDDVTLAIDTRAAAFRPGLVDGLSVLPLHVHGTESVAMVRWAPGTHFVEHQHRGGRRDPRRRRRLRGRTWRLPKGQLDPQSGWLGPQNRGRAKDACFS